MFLSAYGRGGFRRHRGEPEITFKVVVTYGIHIRRSVEETTYRVSWLVAGSHRSRRFESWELAEKFRDMLVVASQQGQPFDVKSGLPISMLGTRHARTRKRRRRGGDQSCRGGQ